MRRRCVVTGLGVATPLGLDCQTFFANLLAGRSGIKRIRRFDTSNLPVQIAGEITDFNPLEKFDAKLIKRTDLFTQYALWATAEAIADSGISLKEIDPYRIGVLIGSGMGGIETWEKEHEKFLKDGPKRVSPFLVPMMIPDMASGQVAIFYGLKGPNFCTVSACASGAHAIGESFRLISYGDADLMVTGGSEAPLTAYTIAAFSNMGALSKRNDQPEKASRPFDRDRDGFVISEGAGVVILEELEHAQRRGAKIYCELVGYGATADAYHITAPDPEGEGTYEVMRRALLDAGMEKEEVDYINAHGTSTKLNDLTETKAIKNLFKEHAKRIAINSTKSMIGHSLGAAGAIEFIVTCLSVYHQKVHPTINRENPDPELDLDYVVEGSRNLPIRFALSNSLGFGGHNTCLAVRRWER
ncbi:MAG: beta-ketoacyl-ACP synthase II [candidate division WOR-3 bacterium]